MDGKTKLHVSNQKQDVLCGILKFLVVDQMDCLLATTSMVPFKSSGDHVPQELLDLIMAGFCMTISVKDNNGWHDGGHDNGF